MADADGGFDRDRWHSNVKVAADRNAARQRARLVEVKRTAFVNGASDHIARPKARKQAADAYPWPMYEEIERSPLHILEWPTAPGEYETRYRGSKWKAQRDGTFLAIERADDKLGQNWSDMDGEAIGNMARWSEGFCLFLSQIHRLPDSESIRSVLTRVECSKGKLTHVPVSDHTDG